MEYVQPIREDQTGGTVSVSHLKARSQTQTGFLHLTTNIYATRETERPGITEHF